MGNLHNFSTPDFNLVVFLLWTLRSYAHDELMAYALIKVSGAPRLFL